MGGSPQLLEEIYALEARDRRPLGLPGPPLDDGRWLSRLGDRSAYTIYLVFFKEKIARHGVTKPLEDCLMAPDANFNGASMFGRLFGGAMHPLIHIGFGVELGRDSLVAQGLAMCAGTEGDFSSVVADHWSTAMPKVPDVPTQGVTLFSILRQMYESPDLLSLLPYVPNDANGAGFYKLCDSRTRTHALRGFVLAGDAARLLPHAHAHQRNRPAPPAPCAAAETPQGPAAAGIRPRLRTVGHRARAAPCQPLAADVVPNLPVPAGLKTSTATDPWAQLITNALQDFDSHVVKTVRALYSGHIHFGKVAAGQVVGAFDESGRETHPGLSKLDGTAWIRAAGITCSALGWMGFGEEAGRWDRSVLGLNAAWE
ncbi:unnamed protein product [Mycena citricolor]|uniref:Uncharacterized protein n=1 Tax=Mycena citricolor TaxID=2018698 RepID=A0AAD2JWX3_9AGAR|nr:unnamed protein product [Mycena citricolor]